MQTAYRLKAVFKLRKSSILKNFLVITFMIGIWKPVHTICPTDQSIKPCRCAEKLKEIHVKCNYGNLNSISSALKTLAQKVPQVDELILESNFLNSLPNQAFSPLRVVRLMIKENGVQEISTNWLAGTEATLHEIFIIEPELETFPDGTLITLPHLEALTLSSGQMKRMPSIFGLSRLKYILIDAPLLSFVEYNNFQGLPFVEQIHITSTQRIQSLNHNFIHDLPNLTMLNFSQCALQFLHSRAFERLPSVTEVSFSGNKFNDARMVGMAIRNFPNIATVRLDNNQLQYLEEGSFVDIPSLRNLYLNNNKITHILRASFHYLTQLKALDLSKNNIRAIHPEGFLPVGESVVEELLINGNEISAPSILQNLLYTLPRLRHLDMSNNLLNEVIYGTGQNHLHLEMLVLENNRIEKIGREAFVGLRSLRELRLANNRIGYHLGTPYWSLPSLKGLDLSNNQFEYIDSGLLHGLPSLRKFDISGNQLKSVEPASFYGSPYLEHVNVSKNQLREIHPFTFFQLQRLFELDVSYNNLSQGLAGIPVHIENLFMAGNNIVTITPASMAEIQNSALKFLDLSHNKILKIPSTSTNLNTFCTLRTLLLNDNSLQVIDQPTFSNFPQLRILNLANNKLISLKNDAFKKLQYLAELNLGGNRLEVLEPDLFTQNPNLRKLDLSHNILTEIPSKALSANRKIEQLDLSENSLIEFPITATGLSSLETLNLKKNSLRSIPNNILPTLPSLKEINLSGNKIRELLNGTIAGQKKLLVVDLEDNEIETIDSHAFSSAPKLSSVKMARNKISSISESAFDNLPQLETVELQENKLNKVANGAFKSCPSLLMLNLSHNDLNSMERAGLNGLKSLEALDLSNNRIKRLTTESIGDMNFLVLLKLDNNRLCHIEGSPFEKMSKLKMLSLRDNKMTSLAEPAFSKFRSNSLYFDIEGNPVKCACNMFWMKSLRQNDPHQMGHGPQCSDGIVLKDSSSIMSLNNCENPTDIIPGCDPPPPSGRSPVSVTLKSTPESGTTNISTSNSTNRIDKPLPEETDYFDPNFIEDKNATIKKTPISNDTGTPLTLFGKPVQHANLDNVWGKRNKHGRFKGVQASGGENSNTKNATSKNKKAKNTIPLTQSVIEDVDEFLEEVETSRWYRNVSKQEQDTDLETTTQLVYTNTTNAVEIINSPESITEMVSDSKIIERLDASNLSFVTQSVMNESIKNTTPSKLSDFLIPGGQIPVNKTILHKPGQETTSSTFSSPAYDDLQMNNSTISQNTTNVFEIRNAKPTNESYPTTINENNNNSINWYFMNYNRTGIQPYVGRLPNTIRNNVEKVIPNLFVLFVLLNITILQS